MKARTTALLLLSALLIASSLAACGDDASTPAVTTDGVTDTATADTDADGDGRLPLGLPEMDFKEATYRISGFAQSDLDSIYLETDDGEAVNSTIYERCHDLMDTYNFKFEMILNDDWNAHTAEVARLALAAEDAWELICGHVVTTCNNAVSGLYLDLYEVPHLDFSKPWWPRQTVEEMTVYDRMFTVTSNINYKAMAGAKIIFFNKEMLAANDLPLPYDMVRDGTWTMDRLIEQTKDLYFDANQDGKANFGDTFGFTSYWTQNGFFTSCDAPILAKTEDGGYEFAVMSEKTANLVDKLYTWYYESGDVFLAAYDDWKEDFIANVFGVGNAAYAFGKPGQAVQFYRDSDVSYGVVPMPKYDEDQEDYYAFTSSSLFSIPISCQNTEFAGFVFEALTYYGYYDVVPVYYEKTLKGKIADSPDDREMLQLINDGLTASFAYCYDNWEGFAHLLGAMGFSQTSGSRDLASMYETKLKTAQARLDAVLEGFYNYEG